MTVPDDEPECCALPSLGRVVGQRKLRIVNRTRPDTNELLGIAPDWCGGLTVDEYMDQVRDRVDPL